jgi:hypothetical protein
MDVYESIRIFCSDKCAILELNRTDYLANKESFSSTRWLCRLSDNRADVK